MRRCVEVWLQIRYSDHGIRFQFFLTQHRLKQTGMMQAAYQIKQDVSRFGRCRGHDAVQFLQSARAVVTRGASSLLLLAASSPLALAQDDSIEDSLVPAYERVSETVSNTLTALPLLAISAAVVAAFWILGHWIGRSKLITQRVAPNPFVGELLSWTIRAALLLAGLLLAFRIMDATALLGSVLGGIGVLGLALGFAVRDTVENFIASVLLSVRQPFSAGDQVDIEGHVGRVLRLTSRATILMDADGNHIRIPNATVYKGISVNYTRNPHRRFQFEVGVDASIAPTEAQDIALEALKTIPTVLGDPGPGCLIKSLGDSNVVLSITGWVDQRVAAFGKTRSASIAVVKRALEDAEIAMPEPIYNVRIARGEVPVSGSVRRARNKRAPEPAPTRSELTPDEPVAGMEDDDAGKDLLSETAPKE